MINQPQAPLQPVKPQQGSGFVNLSQFLSANQGNKLGQTLGNQISGAAQQTKQGLGTANEAFQKDLQQNKLNTSQNQQQASNIINQASNLGENQGLNAADTSAFQRLTGGGYNGPKSLSNANQLQSQAEQAQQYGQAVGNQYGRLGLLKSLVGQGNYTQGQASLDNMLLGKAPELQQAQRQTRGLVGDVNNAVNIAGQQAQNVAQQNKQFGNNVLGQAGQAYTGYGAGLNQRAQQARADQAIAYQTDINKLNNHQVIGNIIPGTATYNVDPTQYLTQYDPTQINAQTIANSSDIARLNALSQLAQQQNNVASQVASNQYNPITSVGFDQNSFNNAIANNKNIFNNAVNSFNVTRAPVLRGYAPSPISIQPGLAGAGQISLPDALAKYQQLALSGTPQAVKDYQTVLNFYNNLQTQYGANNYLGGAAPSTSTGVGLVGKSASPGFQVPS